eukprot:s636_g20.t1
MAWLARASKNVRCLAVMILGRMSSLAMARLLLAAVERSVPNRRRRKYLKASFGCLTAKNLQHILQCHDLGQDCSCPDLAGRGSDMIVVRLELLLWSLARQGFRHENGSELLPLRFCTVHENEKAAELTNQILDQEDQEKPCFPNRLARTLWHFVAGTSA